MVRSDNDRFLLLTGSSNRPQLFLKRLAHRMIRWEHAQVVTLYLQGAVETGTEILQCDRRRQFDDLSGSKETPQFFKRRIGNFRWRPGHALGVTQHRLFAAIEMAAGFEYRNIL